MDNFLEVIDTGCSKNKLKEFLIRNYRCEKDPGPCDIGRYEEHINIEKFLEEFLDFCGLKFAFYGPYIGKCYINGESGPISFGMFLNLLDKKAKSLDDRFEVKYILSESDYKWLIDNYSTYNSIPPDMIYHWYENCKNSDVYDDSHFKDFVEFDSHFLSLMIFPTNPWTEVLIESVIECVLGCIDSSEILSSKINEFIDEESKKTIIYGVWETEYRTNESIRCYRDKTIRDEYFKANKTKDYGDNLEKFRLPCLLEEKNVVYGVYRIEDNYDYNEAKDLKLFGNKKEAEEYKDTVAKFENDIVETFIYHV